MATETRSAVDRPGGRSSAPQQQPKAGSSSDVRPTAPGGTARIVSLDQFRGYTVAGMFVVNFLGIYSAAHYGLKHNDRFFTWADSIMPSFMFICGVSYRLSVLRKLTQRGALKTYAGVVKRSLALVLVSLVMYGFGRHLPGWDEVNAESVKMFVANILKADLWEVLSIIGMCQILLIPFVGKSFGVRLVAMIGFSLLHVAISGWFNFWFVYGKPVWMDDVFFGLIGRRAWDGGCFGIISWSVPMLAGTLVYDLLSAKGPARSIVPLLVSGILLMGVGYGLSGLSRLYDVREGATVATYPGPGPGDYDGPEPPESFADTNFAASPVLPPFQNAGGRAFTDLLGDPPFLPIPPPDQRKINYWMMDKRMASQSFMLFATGFGITLYVVFILACDLGGVAVPLFRTFGTNALAAYAIHHAVELLVHQVVPEDATVWPVTIGFTVFFLITWMMVRFLEKNKIFIRL